MLIALATHHRGGAAMFRRLLAPSATVVLLGTLLFKEFAPQASGGLTANSHNAVAFQDSDGQEKPGKGKAGKGKKQRAGEPARSRPTGPGPSNTQLLEPLFEAAKKGG